MQTMASKKAPADTGVSGFLAADDAVIMTVSMSQYCKPAESEVVRC